MARPKKPTTAGPVEAADEAGTPADEASGLEDGKILDYITGKPVAENDKERVRQRIARAMFHEYGISVDDMEPDFRVKVDGSHKKVDIAIFEPGAEHTAGHVRRIVVCQKELKIGDKGAYKMRDHEQAEKEFGLLHGAMTELPYCKYGLWTNGLEFFFFEGTRTRFDVKFKPIGDWPMGDESIGTRDVVWLGGAEVCVKHGHPGNLDEQERHHERGNDAGPPVGLPHGKQPEAPPKHRLTEVVRMAAESPEPRVENLPSACRITPERLQLSVRNDFHDKPDREDKQSSDVGQTDGVWMARGCGELEWRRNEHHQTALQNKNLEEADPPITSRAVALTERGIAWVLGLATAPEEQVQPQADRPESHHSEEQRLCGREAGRDSRVSGDEQEGHRPPRVDDAGVAANDADDPQGGHQTEHQGGVLREKRGSHSATSNPVFMSGRPQTVSRTRACP